MSNITRPPLGAHTLSSDGESSSSAYSDNGTRPEFQRRSTDNLLDYYQSEDAGKTYVRPLSTATVKEGDTESSFLGSDSSHYSLASFSGTHTSVTPEGPQAPTGHSGFSSTLEVGGEGSGVDTQQQHPNSHPNREKAQSSSLDAKQERPLPGTTVSISQSLDVSLANSTMQHVRSEASTPDHSLMAGRWHPTMKGSHSQVAAESNVAWNAETFVADEKNALSVVKLGRATETLGGVRGEFHDAAIGRPISPAIADGDASGGRHIMTSTHQSFQQSSPQPFAVSSKTSTKQNKRSDQAVPIADPQFLNYVAGVHATAGPPPPPPQANQITSKRFPPPRPPRMHSPAPLVKTTSAPLGRHVVKAVPSSVSAASQFLPSSRIPLALNERQIQLPTSVIDDDSRSGPSSNLGKRMHVREAALSEDTVGLDASIAETASSTCLGIQTRPDAQWDDGNMNKAMQDAATLRDNCTLVGRELNYSDVPMLADETQSSKALVSRDGFLHQPLPQVSRSASPASSQQSSYHSDFTRRSTRRGNTSLSEQLILSSWPKAMLFHDISNMKSSLERAQAYAQRTAELSIYDCGLRDWIDRQEEIRQFHRGSTHQKSGLSLVDVDSLNRPRQVSHGSMASEATFPLRSDAYTATDLSLKPDEISSTFLMGATLPYPSLMQGIGRQDLPDKEPSLSSASPRAVASGFFSSLGRKASAKREKPFINSSHTKLVTSRQPQVLPAHHSRPVKLGPATLPGGPRSPNKPNRASTIVASKRLPEDVTPQALNPPPKATMLARSPSLPATSTSRLKDIVSDQEFSKQVDRLADVLPHVSRSILAGYLQRAGQDILAIGQYLEDEKNGTIQL